jgi:hypothetical protein
MPKRKFEIDAPGERDQYGRRETGRYNALVFHSLKRRQEQRVLRAGKLKRGNGHLPPVPGFKWEFTDLERLSAAPSVPLIARDAFVTDMAIRLDQVQNEIKALAREFESAKRTIAEIREDTDRNYRFSSFQDGEQRARSQKVEDILRRVRNLKTRLDAIDGKREGDFQSFDSLESISKRLTELGTLQRQFRDVERKLKYSAGLFCGSVVLWLVTFLSS